MNEDERRIAVFQAIHRYTKPLRKTAEQWLNTSSPADYQALLERAKDQETRNKMEKEALKIIETIALFELLESCPESRKVLGQISDPGMDSGLTLHQHIRLALEWQPGTNPAHLLREAFYEEGEQFKAEVRAKSPVGEASILLNHRLTRMGANILVDYYDKYCLKGYSTLILIGSDSSKPKEEFGNHELEELIQEGTLLWSPITA